MAGVKPFVVVLGEDAIRDALAQCDDLHVFAKTYHDATSFLNALHGEIPQGIDPSIVVVSDQVGVVDGVGFEGIVQTLRDVAVAICWRTHPGRLADYVPVLTPPVTVASLRELISTKCKIPLPGGSDQLIYVPGVQEVERGESSSRTGSTTFGSIVSNLAQTLGVEDLPSEQDELFVRDEPEMYPTAPTETYPTYERQQPVSDEKDADNDIALKRLAQLVGDLESPSSNYPNDWTQSRETGKGSSSTAVNQLLVNQLSAQQLSVNQLSAQQLSVNQLSAQPINTNARHVTRVCRVIATWSSKGGVGKTTVAINLAARAAMTGLRVLLMDLDLDSGDVAARLMIKGAVTIMDVIRNPDNLVRDHLVEVLPISPTTNVALLLPPIDLNQAMGGSVTVGTYERVLKAATGCYDLIVLDCGAGVGNDLAVRFALLHSDAVALVIDNEGAAMVNLKRTLKHLVEVDKRLSWEQFGIVVNQQVEGRGGYSINDISKWFAPCRIVGRMPDARGELLAAQTHGRVAIQDPGPIGNAMRSMIDGVIRSLLPEIGELLDMEEYAHQSSISSGASWFRSFLNRMLTRR